MAQEHQEYIQQKVNPILENLVTQLLLERPEQLAPFMIKWLSEHSKTPATASLSERSDELTGLRAELEQLQAEVKALEADRATEKPSVPASAAPNSDDEDEDDDDDDVDDDAMPPPESYMKKERQSVSAEAYGAWNVKAAFTPPVHAKTDDTKKRIQGVLKDSFLFSQLDQANFDIVIDAMVEKKCESQFRIINQADDGDLLYVVESGEVHCFKKDDKGEEKLVKKCFAGDAFGELALLYNCPRAASVVAQGDCILWQLDRETFNHIVKDAACKRRETNEAFLKTVPLFDAIESYELQSMCDALQSETFLAGSVIVRQGDPGDKFYLLESGEAVCTKMYVPDTPSVEVMQYAKGDYFGELALLRDEPRAATVTAKTDVTLLSLGRRTFKNLLGPLEDILMRGAGKYS